MNTGADMRDNDLMEQLLGKVPSIAGIELRSPAMATFAVLRLAKSALLIAGGTRMEDQPELELLKFIVLIDARRSAYEAYTLAQNETELLRECLELGETLDYTKMPDITEGITTYLKDALRNRTEIIPDAKEASDPNEQGV